MKDAIQQLEALLEKIQSVWGMLGIEGMKEEIKTIEVKMQSPGFWDDPEAAAKVSKQHEGLRSEVETWERLKKDCEELRELAGELDEQPDEELKNEIESKIKDLAAEYERLEFVILMDGKHDKKSAIVTVYAGSGGTEAQDWAEMLRRMIVRFCERKEWAVTILDESRGTEAGIKSSTLRIEGRYAYGYLQSEHGTHRLVRISPFDSDKNRHTSFANIEVIPEIEHDDVEIDKNDLRIDTFMSGGNGGQSVNTTYSAVRIVHVPTGITVQCQNEKSQLQNKASAMKVLLSRLQQLKEEEEAKERQELRGEVKAAEWGSQIRSYVLHPYKMVKDLRTRYEESDPDAVLDGGLDQYIENYLRWKRGEHVSGDT